jgi:uncharacterized protein (TIGR02421 family)
MVSQSAARRRESPARGDGPRSGYDRAVNEAERYRALLARLGPVLEAPSERRTRVLEAIAWPREVEDRFFASGATELPRVVYPVDRAPLQARVQELQEALGSIDGDDPVAEWARANVQSSIDGCRLVLAMGTTEFYRLSREIYGGARTRFDGTGERNIDLAEHLLDRLRVHGWDEARDAEPEALSDQDLVDDLGARLAKRFPSMKVEFVIDDDLTAKVIAGTSRVRVRRGATFMPWEADGLWYHEVSTHVLTAQNGAAQREVPFLRAGGPRTTRTQEGLAVFSELFHHALATPRMERLALRVKLVDMAEGGADFLDLYRHLVERGSSTRDAYLDAQRVCRGGRVEGAAPFTKDASYLAGLLDVQAFLSVVVRGGFRDELELLASGRIALDDLHALVLLRRAGILRRPRYIPTWLKRWNVLVPEFAFRSFLSDLPLEPLRAHYRALVECAAAQRPPGDPDAP